RLTRPLSVLIIASIVIALYSQIPKVKIEVSTKLPSRDYFSAWKTIASRKHNLTLDDVKIQPVIQKIAKNTHSTKTRPPLILIWTKYFGGEPLTNLEGFSNRISSCEYLCEYTGNRDEHFQSAEAVLFHSGSMDKNDTTILISLTRPQGQVWIYNNQESPANMETFTKLEILPHFRNLFNWTMTMRKDSDIYHPYGKIVKTEPMATSIWNENLAKRRDIIRNKSKFAVWVTSHCITNSRREKLVRELARYIPIDIVGACGTWMRNYCIRKGTDYDTCFTKFAANYKFYLSFENSLCQDYVTEKFYNAVKHDIVPVVYSGGDMKSLAPRGSYIDVRDFNGSRHLAEYLIELDKKEEEYEKYFEFKRNHEIIDKDEESWCRLCEKVWLQRGQSVVQWYPDMAQWYENEFENGERTGAKSCVDKSEIVFKTAMELAWERFWDSIGL
ncbi:Alpha-(1,3)-fucosyltransferase C, partial [Folsomia candida]